MMARGSGDVTQNGAVLSLAAPLLSAFSPNDLLSVFFDLRYINNNNNNHNNNTDDVKDGGGEKKKERLVYFKVNGRMQGVCFYAAPSFLRFAVFLNSKGDCFEFISLKRLPSFHDSLCIKDNVKFVEWNYDIWKDKKI
jgi:hypothetical protein